MNPSHPNPKILLTLIALLAIALTARAQTLINDAMEGYPTATSTSVPLGAGTSDPAYWELVGYAGSGSVAATAGIGTGNGNPGRAAVMNATFPPSPNTYAGLILNSSSYGSGTPATQGNTLADFHYSVDLRGSQAAAVTVVFLSVNSSFAITGSMAKTFTLAAANSYQTFAGNLGQAGWAPDPTKAAGASLNLHAPYYAWSILIQAEQPGGWGFDSGNVLNVDNVQLTAQSGGGYLPVTYDANGFFHLNSGQSDYVGYRPDTYSDATPISLFVWMHGCGGNAEGDLFTIAPYPTRATQSYIAISIGGRDGDCWTVGTDTPKVLAAITDIARYFNINPRKVYLGGYSSGGDMTYRVGFENALLFAGLLVENSDPFSDTGAPNAYLGAAWKLNVAHLAHLSDTTYPIGTVRTNLATLTANGFPVTKIEKAGTHYDPDSGAFGTNYDLRTFLLPYLDAGWLSPSGSPDISVEQPIGTVIPDGGALYSTTIIGSPVSLVYTIRNPGGANLTGLVITKDGANAADFTVTASPTAPVLPGASTAFTVQFAPTTSGVKFAAIHIASNVTAKNPYDINVTSRALSFTQDTDGDGLNDAAEFQWAPLGFDWQVSQPAQVSAFNAQATAAGYYTAAQVQALNVGVPLIQKNATTGLFTLTLGLQKSTNLNVPNSFVPFPFTAPQTTINGQGKLQFQFSVPDNAAFFRLQAQ